MKNKYKYINIYQLLKYQSKKFWFTIGERGNGKKYFEKSIKKDRNNGK